MPVNFFQFFKDSSDWPYSDEHASDPPQYHCLTFPRLVLYVDGLSLIISVVVLDTHQMWVGLCTEASSDGHHMLIAILHYFHQLCKMIIVSALNHMYQVPVFNIWENNDQLQGDF